MDESILNYHAHGFLLERCVGSRSGNYFGRNHAGALWGAKRLDRMSTVLTEAETLEDILGRHQRKRGFADVYFIKVL